MGEMKRGESRYRAEYAMKQERFASTLVIAAAIIAAVRLAREPDVSKPSPRVVSAVGESVSLARMILDNILR
jgi:hypothetical protein